MINYPISLPSDRFKSDEMDLFSYKYNDKSLSGRRTTTSFNGGKSDYWYGVFTTPYLEEDEFRKWVNWRRSMVNDSGSFYASDTVRTAPTNAVIGTPKVDGAGQLGSSLPTKNWAPNTLVLEAGDYFQVGTEYYQLKEDILTDALGKVILNFMPSIRTAQNDNAPIITDNPKMIAVLTDVNAITTRDVRKKGVFSFAWEQKI
jgi:hypothetical protein